MRGWARLLGFGPIYRDRIQAGEVLADLLQAHRGQRVVVLGVPRGGVPVAAIVARRLGADLDVVVARKIGAPGQRELAVGAATADGTVALNPDVVAELGLGRSAVERASAGQVAEARRLEQLYRGGEPAADIAGRVAIVVDDGLATGATVRAAVASVRLRGPARLVVAVPVGSWQACELIAAEVNELVCPEQPDPFWAVGLHYASFDPTDDAEVVRLLAEARDRRAGAASTGVQPTLRSTDR